MPPRGTHHSTDYVRLSVRFDAPYNVAETVRTFVRPPTPGPSFPSSTPDDVIQPQGVRIPVPLHVDDVIGVGPGGGAGG